MPKPNNNNNNNNNNQQTQEWVDEETRTHARLAAPSPRMHACVYATANWLLPAELLKNTTRIATLKPLSYMRAEMRCFGVVIDNPNTHWI